MRSKLFLITCFHFAFMVAVGQSPKPSIADTRKWIAEKLSLYAKGFKMVEEVRKPGVILGDRTTSFEINQISYTQSNLVIEFRVTTYLKNCCQEHTTNNVMTVTIPWAIFRSEDNYSFTPKDSLTTGRVFEPSGNYALFIQADGNQINYLQGESQVLHKELDIDNGTTKNVKEYVEPAISTNVSVCFMGFNITGEQNLKKRLQTAFGDLIKYNMSKPEAY